MRLKFRQRSLTLLDKYDIYDDYDKVVYTVKGEMAAGQSFKITDAEGVNVGTVTRRVLAFVPKFEIYQSGMLAGSLSKETGMYMERYNVDYKGYKVIGDVSGKNYTIQDNCGRMIAKVSKEVFKFVETNVINIVNPSDAEAVVLLVVAIDAEKASATK